MILPIKQILLEDEIILEISALKARQMSLKAGIIPDHNTNWKGALKKVRGQRGELTSGRELSNIKQKMGFPENNVLQKLKSAENKMPREHEVAYDQKTKNIIKGNKGSVFINKNDFEKTNNNQVGFIHTHPYFDKIFKKQHNIENLDRPGGLKINNYNNRMSLGDFDRRGHSDIQNYADNPTTKFPIYAPSDNTLSVSRIFLKQPNPIYNFHDLNSEQNYKNDVKITNQKKDRLYKIAEKNNNNYNRYNKIMDKWAELQESLPQRPKLYKDNYYKMNHARFIVGKENYDKFNLNGEQIK